MKKNKIFIILLLISIISIIISFFLYLYIIPLCIIEIIINLLLLKKGKIYYLNIILNIVCVGISIVLFIFFKPKPLHNIVGIWNCSSYNNQEYVVTLTVNNSNKFIWSKYNNEKNNYILGNYQIKKIDKKDNDKTVYYYNFIIDSSKYIENGIEKNIKFHKECDIAINTSENKLVLVSSDDIILKCNRINNENPIIK